MHSNDTRTIHKTNMDNSTQTIEPVEQPDKPVIEEDSTSDEKPDCSNECSCQVFSALVGYSELTMESGRLRVPLAKVGMWHHDKYGKVSFSIDDFENIIGNYESDVLGFLPYLTYGHPVDDDEGEFVERARSLDAERKHGDLKKLVVEGDTLVGYFDADDEAYELVKENKYEYSSGEFLHNFINKETGRNQGTVVLRTALTNAPFLTMREKVMALSMSPQSQSIAVFKLSMKDIDNSNMQEATATTPTVEVTELEKEVEVVATPNLEQLVNVAIKNVGAMYNDTFTQMKAEADETIQTLRAELAQMKEELSNTKQVTTAFSTDLSTRARKERNIKLEKEGVAPALIERFSLLADAISNGQRVLKFSTSEGDKENDIVEELQELLVKAVQSNPIPYIQFGQSATRAESGLEGQLRSIASANWKNAEKKLIK